ncbi:MAG TPA: CCA tRNA nucleotidyltransferase [Verrucomicrobiae bacterium]|nr:CCA tRNA nucleotidyltransferase [Verrucomicrobiae bacterium]
MTHTTPDILRHTATIIVRHLQEAGFAAFWVGGCVRDFLLGREPGDYDIATNAVPDEIERLFPKTIAVGRKFGVMVVVENGAQFQVATFRAESDYRDGRHPSEVTFGDPQADAARRDFTINGLFYDPVQATLRDWVGGQADLERRVIRTIGHPAERFAEDHLRLLRAVRFAAQLDFTIEPATLAAVRALAPKIKAISPERVRDELAKLFQPGRAKGAVQTIAARGLVLLHKSGLLGEVLPEIAACATCEQSPDFHPEGTVFQHLVLMLQNLPDDADPLLAWAVLLHDVAKPLTAERDPATGSIHFYGHEKLGADLAVAIMTRLRFPKKQIEDVATAVRFHMQFKDAPQMRKATLRRLLLRPTFALELALHRLDCLGSHGRLDIYDFLVAQAAELARQPQILPPLVTGEDLKALGVAAGPGLGALLTEIRDQQLAEELTSRDAALDWVRAQLGKDR